MTPTSALAHQDEDDDFHVNVLTQPYTGPVRLQAIDFTPEIAALLLNTMLPNRQLRRAVVEAYARDMKAGKWRLTGDAVRIDRDGNLIDGEHRLRAILLANVTVRMFVAIGLATEDRKYVDTGAKRKSADVLTFEGRKNSTVLAAAVRLAILDEQGFLETSGGLKTGGGQYQVTRSQEIEYLAANPGLADAVNDYTQVARKRYFPTGAFTYGMFLLRGVSEDDAQLFGKHIGQNITAGQGDPFNALLDYGQKNNDRKTRMGNGEALYVLFTAWNAWRTQKQLKSIRAFMGTKDKPIAREIPTPK